MQTQENNCSYGYMLAAEQQKLKEDIARQLDKILMKLDEYNKNHTDLRLDVHQLKIITKSNTKDIDSVRAKQENLCKEIRVQFDDVREDTVNTRLKQSQNSTTVKIMYGIGGTVLLIATQLLVHWITK